MRRTEQRRAAVVALYQHDLTGRPLGETLGGDASPMTMALAHAAADRSDELDAVLDRHAHGWSVQRIQPLERSIMRVALIEILHPDVAPGAGADPGGGGDRRGGGEREGVLRRGCAGVRERGAGGGVAGSARECVRHAREYAAEGEPQMNETEQIVDERLDELISKLERAAEQLRSGELTPDAAATLVEDCAGLAGEAAAELERRSRAEVSTVAPGQDSLL